MSKLRSQVGGDPANCHIIFEKEIDITQFTAFAYKTVCISFKTCKAHMLLSDICRNVKGFHMSTVCHNDSPLVYTLVKLKYG